MKGNLQSPVCVLFILIAYTLMDKPTQVKNNEESLKT